MKKGIIRTILDDHRDVYLYRHALVTIYLKLSGKSSGHTAHYEDETGYIKPVFNEIKKLQCRIKELEETIFQLENSKN